MKSFAKHIVSIALAASLCICTTPFAFAGEKYPVAKSIGTSSMMTSPTPRYVYEPTGRTIYLENSEPLTGQQSSAAGMIVDLVCLGFGIPPAGSIIIGGLSSMILAGIPYAYFTYSADEYRVFDYSGNLLYYEYQGTLRLYEDAGHSILNSSEPINDQSITPINL